MLKGSSSWRRDITISVAAAALLGGGLVAVDQFRTPMEVRRLLDEDSEAKRIARMRVMTGSATQGMVEWSWLGDAYTIKLAIGSLFPGDAREVALFTCETPRSAQPYWSYPWTVEVYLVSGSRPAARCEI
jgi:hypothetical protein